jgi:hypothetical protein
MPRRPTRVQRPPWMVGYLEAFRQTGIHGLACRRVGISRSTPFKWLDRHPDGPGTQPGMTFAEEWDEAGKEATDVLESEALRRGVQGVEEPVFGNLRGKEGENFGTGVVGHVRKYDTALLIFLMKSRDPERFRERHAVDISGTLVTESQVDRDLAEAVTRFEAIAARAEAPGDGTPERSGTEPAVG